MWGIRADPCARYILPRPAPTPAARRWGWEGVYVTTESRKPRDVRGLQLPLRFKVVDARPPVRGAQARSLSREEQEVYGGKDADEGEGGGGKGGSGKRRAAPAGRGPYKVSIQLTGGWGGCRVGGRQSFSQGLRLGHRRPCWPALPLQHQRTSNSSPRGPPAPIFSFTHPPTPQLPLLPGVGQKEMNAGERPVIGMADVLNGTGAYTMEIPCPRSRSTATIRVEMRDESRLVFVDEFRWAGPRAWTSGRMGAGRHGGVPAGARAAPQLLWAGELQVGRCGRCKPCDPVASLAPTAALCLATRLVAGPAHTSCATLPRPAASPSIYISTGCSSGSSRGPSSPLAWRSWRSGRMLKPCLRDPAGQPRHSPARLSSLRLAALTEACILLKLRTGMLGRCSVTRGPGRGCQCS